MHILIVADGRSPITRRWIESVRALDYHITLVSTFPCGKPSGIDRLFQLPIAFNQLASRQGQSSGGDEHTAVKHQTHLLSSQKSAFIKMRYILGPLTIRLAAQRFRQIVNEVKPDLVHALRIPFEGMLASFAPRSMPFIVSIWGNDLTLHAPTSAGMTALTRRTLRRADGLLADVQRDIRLGKEWGFPPDRPSLIVPGNGGIDFSAMQRERSALPADIESSLPAGMPLVVNPRGVRGYTRIDTFFQGIPLVHKTRQSVGFVCPTMQGQPQAIAWMHRLKLDKRTVLMPALPQGQLWELFRRSDISVSITTHDGTPNTLLEAMSCGSFPIAGDLESLREWITPGENGLLVDPGQPHALAEAILQALDQPDLRSRAGSINRHLILSRADVNVIRPQIASFYQMAAGLG